MSQSINLTDIIAPSYYELHHDVIAGRHTYYKLDGGRGSCKSSFVGTEIPYGMMRDASCGKLTNAVIFRRYKENLRDSVYEQLLWGIAQLGVEHLWRATTSPLRLTYLPTGQVILFRGADKVKKAKSIKVSRGYIKYLWFEELDEFEAMEKIRSVQQSVVRGGEEFIVFYSYNPPPSLRSWVNDPVNWTRPELVIRYSDGSGIDGMLFAVFRVPFANNIDPASPLGVSVYSRAVDLIREADRQYSRILWEYEGSELAVDASDGALAIRPDKDGAKVTIPQRSKRLFRQLNIDQGTGGDLYKVFSPTIRDTALFNGFDKLLKRIEFNCSLAYGTLSDPQNVDKTAEEIRSSKQRSYSAVCAIQKQLEIALRQLVWIMDFYATLYQLAPRGEYELNLAWGDGVLQDTDKEYARRRELADMGYIKPEKLVAWYFGVSEEEAAEYMPARTEGLRFEGE